MRASWLVVLSLALASGSAPAIMSPDCKLEVRPAGAAATAGALSSCHPIHTVL